MNAWIVTYYEPLPFGATETRPQRCGMLAKALLDRGHSVELWTTNFDHIHHVHHNRGSKLEKAGERIYIQSLDSWGYPHDKSPKRFLHNRQLAKEFMRVATSRPKTPDIIFAPVPSLELAEAAVCYAKQRNIPIVVDVRDLWPEVYLTMFPDFVHSIVKHVFFLEYRRARRIFRNATGITAISRRYLEWGLRHAQRGLTRFDGMYPIGYMSNSGFAGGEIETTAASLASKYGINSKCFIASFVGTFNAFCDTSIILDAARLLIDHRDVIFLVAGKGDRSEEFARQASQLTNVIFTGWLDAPSVRAILSLSDVGLVSYTKDALMSLPNKPFEYMAAGLPLVSSLAGELEELILKNDIGRTYQAGSPESLAETIKWLAGHSEDAKKMGKRALNLYEGFFQSNIVYARLSEHLERILGHHAKANTL